MQETLEKTRAMVHHLAAVNEILEKIGCCLIETHKLGKIHIRAALSGDDVLSADRAQHKSFFNFHISFSFICSFCIWRYWR